MKKRLFYLIALCYSLVTLSVFTSCSDDDEPEPTAPAVAVSSVSFSDTDNAAGTIAGTLSWTAPSSVKEVTKYIIYLSSNGTSKDTKLGEVTVGTNSFSIPAGTKLGNYIVVVAANAVGESTLSTSLAVIDKVPDPTAPTEMVASLDFADTDNEEGKIAGSLTWTAPSDVSNITKYVAYTSTDGTTKGAKIGEATVGTNTIDVPTGTVADTYIIVVAANEIGESQAIANIAITDLIPTEFVYILNAGGFGNNNSNITLYNPAGKSVLEGCAYEIQNKKKLGDTGQDIIVYDGKIYVSMYGSKLLLKLDADCKEEARLSFSESDGAPRQLAAKDGKIFVTLYSGQVAKIDTGNLNIEAYAPTGKNPEGIVENDGKLYVVNSGWGNDSTMTVIDIATFKVSNTINVQTNPEKILASAGKIFVQGYGGNYPDYTYPIQEVDVTTGTVKDIAQASYLCEYDGTVYFVYGETDWSTYTTKNTFASYNAKTGTLNKDNFLTDMPSALASNSVYMMEIDSFNGDIYIGTSDYTTNGDIYRFNKDGKFIEKFETTGVSPCHAVFIRK